MLRKGIQLFSALNSHQKLVVILCMVGLLLVRFDFFFTLPAYKLKEGDSLWQVLNSKVFHNPSLSQISSVHMQQYSQVHWDHLLANHSGEGGHTISIWFNNVTLKEPSGVDSVRNLTILPSDMVQNHFMEVVVHNIVVLGLLFFIYMFLLDSDFLKQRKGIIDIELLGWSLLGIPLILVVVILFLLTFWQVFGTLLWKYI